MITTRDIQNMIKHVSRRSSGRPDKRLIHPVREWGMGLVIFCLVLLGGGLYNVYTHLSFSNLETTLTEPETAIVRYQTKTIETALTTFRERKLNYQELQASFVAPVAEVDTDAEEGTDVTEVAETVDESNATDVTTDTEDATVAPEEVSPATESSELLVE